MIKKVILSMLVVILLAAGVGGMFQPVQSALAQAPTASAATLSEVEIHSLLFMREEEKLARDVYAVLYEEYGEQIFLNIMASEQTHFDQMGVLLERYGLEDPALEPGVYTDDYIQGLYDMLIPMGWYRWKAPTGWGRSSRKWISSTSCTSWKMRMLITGISARCIPA